MPAPNHRLRCLGGNFSSFHLGCLFRFNQQILGRGFGNEVRNVFMLTSTEAVINPKLAGDRAEPLGRISFQYGRENALSIRVKFLKWICASVGQERC